jgi:hypothetical protein
MSNITNRPPRHNGSRVLGISSDHEGRRYTGVGVLILTNYCNRPHFVLGREAYKSIRMGNNYCVSVYEEFGGGIQKPSMGLEANACFELKEETCNLFAFSNPAILTKGVNRAFDIPFKTDRLYRIYVVYIENVLDVLPYFNVNRDILMSQANGYYKYRHFLEMDNLALIALDDIKSAIGSKLNYICIYPEDNAHNDTVDQGFIGMLHVKDGNFISKRLAQFLNREYGNGETGLSACYTIFREGFINCKYYPEDMKREKLISLTPGYCHPVGSNKLKFLDTTTSIDAS